MADSHIKVVLLCRKRGWGTHGHCPTCTPVPPVTLVQDINFGS